MIASTCRASILAWMTLGRGLANDVSDSDSIRNLIHATPVVRRMLAIVTIVLALRFLVTAVWAHMENNRRSGRK